MTIGLKGYEERKLSNNQESFTKILKYNSVMRHEENGAGKMTL